MSGFGISNDKDSEHLSVNKAKPGEWYGYSFYGDPSNYFGRFRNRDEGQFLYFDQSPAYNYDDKGAIWEIKEGEFSIPLSHMKGFFIASQADIEASIKQMNWFREYHNEWVVMTHAEMPPSIGKAYKVFPTVFRLLPYVSEIGRRVVKEGKDKIVSFASPGAVEVITEAALEEYLKKHNSA